MGTQVTACRWLVLSPTTKSACLLVGDNTNQRIGAHRVFRYLFSVHLCALCGLYFLLEYICV